MGQHVSPKLLSFGRVLVGEQLVLPFRELRVLHRFFITRVLLNGAISSGNLPDHIAQRPGVGAHDRQTDQEPMLTI